MEIDLLGSEKQSFVDKIEKDLFENRTLYLTQDISSFSIEEIIQFIHHINIQDELKGLKSEDREPIRVFVNSYGGSVYDGYAIVSELIASKTPIHTIVTGYAMSMGLAIFMAGDKRFISKYGTLMYHEISSSLQGSREEIKRAGEEYDRLQEMYDELIMERSTLTKEELEEHQKSVSDWFIPSKVALEKGLATDLYE